MGKLQLDLTPENVAVAGATLKRTQLYSFHDMPLAQISYLSPSEGPLAFCSGGDQNVRGDTGYMAGGASVGRFHVTDLHVQMRRLPKPVVAMVAGYAIGGGHVLHVVCDLTIAADNPRFGQTGPKVGSFDGGYGAALLAGLVGPKKAKEIWFLCRQYSAEEALDMGLVNRVVPAEALAEAVAELAAIIAAKSPEAIRLGKEAVRSQASLKLADAYQHASRVMVENMLAPDAAEGISAFLEKRAPNWRS